MNGSLRFLLRRARRPRVALLALGLTALSLAAACDDADEGQTPVCVDDPTKPEEACFTAPGSGSGSAGTDSGGSGGSAGEAGAAGEAGQSGAAGAGGDGG